MTVNITMESDHNFYAGLDGAVEEGGLFVATVASLPIGTPVDLTVCLPDIDPCEVRGTVSWIREGHDFNSDFFPGVGVAFLNLSRRACEVFGRFASHRFPILYESAE